MSDNYIVSARKYRPQTFDTVVGQGHITTTLKNAIKNQHLAHAYLFCGPRGVGKTTCARILAKTINCENPTGDTEACGVCNTCQNLKNNTSFNVFELDAASNNGVEHIRELTDQVRFAPQAGRYKVYIIDEVHMLSSAAFNAFLKTLEEPPPYAIFILATTEKHKILPTILSRCQIFDFKRITTQDIVTHLQGIGTKESMVAQEAALHIIAQKSEGCMRDALSMLDRIASFTNGMLTYGNTMEHLNLLDADYYFRMGDYMLSQDVAGALLQLDEALEKGFEGDIILSGLAEHFRNLLLCRDPRMAKLLDVPNEHKPVYNEKANQTPPSFILSALNVLNDSALEYRNANNKRLHVEMCLVKLCFLLQTISGNDLRINSLSGTPAIPEMEKKNSTNVVPPVYSQPQEPVRSAPVVESKPIDYQQVERKESVIAEPAPHRQPVAASGTPTPQTFETTPTLAPTPPPRPAARRVSMNVLDGIDVAVSQAAISNSLERSLSEEVAIQIFEQYKLKLQAENKSVVYGQFSLMKIQVFPPDEVRLIAPAELTETYAKDSRTSLADFYRDATQMIVRITTEVQIDQEFESQNAANRVLSKNEVFDLMAQKNPNLARLRDGLNMHIDY
jgi:DNA polymerase-3 subunit gamma/tau